MFKRIKRNSAAARLFEEQLYQQVAIELAKGQRRDGLWAKALAHSKGSEQNAKALYILYRVQSIKDEIEIIETINTEIFSADIETATAAETVVNAEATATERQNSEKKNYNTSVSIEENEKYNQDDDSLLSTFMFTIGLILIFGLGWLMMFY